MTTTPNSVLTSKLRDVQNGHAYLAGDGTNMHYTVESINETQSTVDIVTPNGKSRRLTYATIRMNFFFGEKGSKQHRLTELSDR